MKLSTLFLLSSGVSALGFGNEERLIVTSKDSLPLKVSEWDKIELGRRGVKFIDITNHESWFWSNKKSGITVPVYRYPISAEHKSEVDGLIAKIDKDAIHSNLANFTSFFSRYYKSESGFESATWLYNKVQEIVLPNSNITVEKFKHDWSQFSIIVRIPGWKSPNTRVVVGAHQDSTNLLFPNLMKAPGADDDGSGVASNLEALRLLVASGIAPENTVEFHFYSAEEGGLLGSLDIFTKYKEDGFKVVSVLQQDMTGYVQKTIDKGKKAHVGLITDYVSPALTEYIKVIIDSYLAIPYVESECGYACSDHASALENGYPSAFVIESEFKLTNPYIHSTMDTLDRLSLEHIAEFTKLAVGYVYELAFYEIEEIEQ